MRTTRYGSGGPPLVLVHGLACDGSDWAAQVAVFEPRTTVIVCELPGHGSSPAIPADCTVGAYGAALVRDLIEQAVGPAILVGHSMGCRIVVEAYRVEPTIASGLVLIDGSRIGAGDPEAAQRALADELAGDGYLRFIRSFFGSMLVADPPTARMILERGLSLPAPVGRMLIANLAGWDAGEVEVALDCIAVPLLAIQTTTMDTARQRASLQPGESSPWLDLIRAHVPHAAITTLFGSGHFPQIERSQEITELIACFAQL